MTVGITAVPTTTSAKQSNSKIVRMIRKRYEKGLKKRKKKNWVDPDHYTKPTELDGSDWYDFGNTTELAGPDAVGDGGLVGKYNGYYFKFQNPLFGDGESGGDLDYSDYMTLYVDPNLSLSSAERRIHFSYSMLYDSATYGGTSVGSDGVMSVGITNEEDSWTVAASYEEEDIRGGKKYSK